MPGRKGIRRDVEALMASLGETGPEVAEALLERGHRGRRCEPCGCPLAVAIRQVQGAGDAKVLGWDRVEVAGMVIPLPQGCREFEHGFDFGHWPELDSSKETDHGDG